MDVRYNQNEKTIELVKTLDEGSLTKDLTAAEQALAEITPKYESAKRAVAEAEAILNGFRLVTEAVSTPPAPVETQPAAPAPVAAPAPSAPNPIAAMTQAAAAPSPAAPVAAPAPQAAPNVTPLQQRIETQAAPGQM